MSDYFLGDRSMGGVISALSYSATTYSAFMMVGLAGLTYKGGVGALGFEIVYFAGVSLVAIFGPRFWAVSKKTGCVTPSEMLGQRYGSRWVAMAAGITGLIFLIPYSAVQLSGVGYLLSGMTGGESCPSAPELWWRRFWRFSSLYRRHSLRHVDGQPSGARDDCRFGACGHLCRV